MSLAEKYREFFALLRGRRVVYDLKAYEKTLMQINAREESFKSFSDKQLKALSLMLRDRLLEGAHGHAILVEAFSLVREAAWRVLGMRPYDVQVMAGAALYEGRLAEMQTGEGKTLAAVLPAYLHGLTGRGVHILTFNDYLARRDAGWMGPVFEFLGLTVGYIQEGMDWQGRQQAYACDITYATAREVGFDYLRDHLCQDPDRVVQRAFYSVIVDEADSLLIDEARIPLVIAAQISSQGLDLYEAAKWVRDLHRGLHFNADAAGRNVYLTDRGLDFMESRLGCGSLHDLRNLELFTGLNLALHAQVLLSRDKDYIVRNGKVELVDEFTGRVAQNRQWPYGLQAAIEAKEGLEIQPEGMIRNAITLVHFMKLYPRLYPRLAAMTATARAASEELYEFYGLKTVVIPPNRACVREDLPDLLFASKAAKEKALVTEIVRVQRTGRPILVGTSSVSESERLAARLSQAGVECHVLNAKHDEQEAAIIARAGRLGAATISTNMAGRGTDIQLGYDDPAEYARVCALGGLYVIGTNRHESRRIDDQLRGRAGRQGDPGSSCFYVSLEDDLIRQYGLVGVLPKRIQGEIKDTPLMNRTVHAEIERAQRIIEDQNFQIRQTLTRYSKMVEDQRNIVSARRRLVLTHKEALTLFQERLPDHYQRVCACVGQDRVQQIEQRVTLFHMDNHWAEYMCEIDMLRKFIHIRSLDGCNPLDLFHRTIIQSFRAMRDATEAAILETLQHIEVSDQGELLNDFLPETPAATWTYVINDNPLGDWTQRLRSQVRNLLKGDDDWDWDS